MLSTRLSFNCVGLDAEQVIIPLTCGLIPLRVTICRIMSKLLDQVRHAIRLKHYSLRTEEAYIFWIKKYIHFHNLRHPQEMREEEIRQFLTHLAVTQNVAAATQNQAFAALLFLYRNVLSIELQNVNAALIRQIFRQSSERVIRQSRNDCRFSAKDF